MERLSRDLKEERKGASNHFGVGLLNVAMRCTDVNRKGRHIVCIRSGRLDSQVGWGSNPDFILLQ